MASGRRARKKGGNGGRASRKHVPLGEAPEPEPNGLHPRQNGRDLKADARAGLDAYYRRQQEARNG